MIKVAPSILAADPLQMGPETERMVRAGCDWLHVDIMDGHFVPNLSFGPSLVSALRKQFGIPLDVHLMIDDPLHYAERFCAAGADWLTVHAEVPGGAEEPLRAIRALGKKAGLSIKPGTQVNEIAHLLPLCDLVLVMTVEPGFGGQKFQPEMIGKLQELRDLGYSGLLEADGGINLQNISLLGSAGLDVAVMGTALFRSGNPQADIQSIHSLKF